MSTRQTVTIQSSADRDQIARWARNVEPGTVVTFRKKSRSTEQNSKLHAMLGEVSKQVEWHGQYLDLEDWKDMFTAALRHARVVPGIDRGTYVPLGMHTSTLTIEEMSNLIELIYAFGADPEHPVTFKDPKQDIESGPSAPEEPVPAEDGAPTVSAASDGDSPLPSSDAPSLADLEWLRNVVRMLWAATNYRGDIGVLKAQKVAALASHPKPDGCPEVVTRKAEAAYGYCRQIVLGELEKADGLAMVAGVVGVDQDEIGASA
ncbi:hypothetical protein G6L12_08140 [Agrobacterium rhizogenes]|nr:hypothetical protein [Rhizobium rhizogenes]NTF74442.1 hypothetical protein [Rhizobium rhizogenes]